MIYRVLYIPGGFPRISETSTVSLHHPIHCITYAGPAISFAKTPQPSICDSSLVGFQKFQTFFLPNGGISWWWSLIRKKSSPNEIQTPTTAVSPPPNNPGVLYREAIHLLVQRWSSLPLNGETMSLRSIWQDLEKHPPQRRVTMAKWQLKVRSDDADQGLKGYESWWLNQPLWKIWVKMGIFPR